MRSLGCAALLVVLLIAAIAMPWLFLVVGGLGLGLTLVVVCGLDLIALLSGR